MQQQLITYLRAGYPGLAIVSAEEVRAEAELQAACAALERRLHAWSSSEGLLDTTQSRASPCPDPLQALGLIERLMERPDPRHVVVMRDLQPYLDQSDPQLVRRLKDILRLAKGGGHSVILLGCRCKLPAEIEHEITCIEFGLPGPVELGAVLSGIIQSARLREPSAETCDAVLQAALGLTTTEAENAMALSIVETSGLDPKVIAREKAGTLKRNGLVEVVETVTDPAEIGGLEELKAWLSRRVFAFTPAARAYGLPAPKGLMILGISGTGKSLTAKASATAFGLPLLKLDMGRVMGGIVGQSEANLRTVIRTAEAIAPCVLWIDEIEKGFSGSQSSGSTDGGTTARIFGSFLSWMAEKKKPVFVVATANDISKLPPEFLRKGRFDEMFFVDLPNDTERRQIWEIVIRRYGRDPVQFDVAALATACADFTGAEIEAVFVDSLHETYPSGEEPAMDCIKGSIARTVPLARLMETQIASLREWARGRAREASAKPKLPLRPSRRVTQAN